MLRLRGGPPGAPGASISLRKATPQSVAGGGEDFQYESLNVRQCQMHDVVYEAEGKVCLKSGESAMVPLGRKVLAGDRVLHYDPKESEVSGAATSESSRESSCS